MQRMSAPRKALSLALAALVSAAAIPAVSQAAEGPWMVRVRAVNLDSANKDDTGLDLSVNNKVIPEVDFSYFFTPNIAAELILTYPQKHDVRAGSTEIGSVKHLPPTLTLQYHFLPQGTWRPYVGIGVNYTRFSSVDLPASYDIKKSSTGLALQAGVDYQLTSNMYLNLDIKKVDIRAKITDGGTEVGTLKIDPLLVGIGLGWRF